MVKTIILSREGLGRLADSEPFLLPDVLELQFVAKGYDMRNVFVSMQNGTIKKHERLKGDTLVVDNELLFAGYLNIRVSAYMGGEIAKIWDIYPLKLVETNYGIETFDYIKIIEDKVDTLQEQVNELKKQHEIIM